MSSFPSASLSPDAGNNAQASSSGSSSFSSSSSSPPHQPGTSRSDSSSNNPDGERPSRKDRLASSLHHRLRALNIPPNLHSMTAGAGAGLVASIITCPLDVVKTRLQAQHVSKSAGYEGFALTVKRIWGQSGLRGFYRGLGPTVGGYLPTWGIYFTVYDLVKDKLGNWRSGGGDHQAPQSTLVHITAAMTAGATGTIMTNPLWVVKTRFMAQAVLPPSGGRYRNTFDAISTIYRQEGFRAFYKGLLPSLMGVTHVAVQFPLYESFKSWADPDGNQSSLSPSTILICSAASKMIASLATYPHEVLRTRLQIAKASSSNPSSSSTTTSSSTSNGTRHLYSPLNTGSNPPHPHPNPEQALIKPIQSANAWVARRRKGGIVDTAIKIKRQDGWRGFYRGLSINLVRTVPNSAVTMLSYELIMRSLSTP